MYATSLSRWRFALPSEITELEWQRTLPSLFRNLSCVGLTATHHRSNSMLNLLVVNSVNRGVLTAVGAGCNFVLVCTQRHYHLTYQSSTSIWVTVSGHTRYLLLSHRSPNEWEVCVAFRALPRYHASLTSLFTVVYMNSMMAT